MTVSKRITIDVVIEKDCVFPFIYKQIIYNEFTLVDSEDGYPWCSKMVDSMGFHIEDEETWGICSHGQGCGRHSGRFNI